MNYYIRLSYSSSIYFILFIISLKLFVSSSQRLKRRMDQSEPLAHASNANHSSPYFNGRNMTDRVAICLTGQLRSANLSWTSGTLVQTAGFKMFGPDDPPTVAETIIEHLFRVAARERGVDVFMYLTAHPEVNNSNWNGRPETYEPMVNDMRACEIFSKNDVFQGTGNRFFCIVEPERELMDIFVRNMTSIWSRLNDHPDQLLAQLYALYRANQAAKEYALMSGAHYKYKIRLRPDTAFVRPFPGFAAFPFTTPIKGTNCAGTIFYANRVIYRSTSNQDWFNVGLTEHMDKLLDRYMDLITTPFISDERILFEDHLVKLMGIRYNICMNWKDSLWMVVIRYIGQTFNSWVPPAIEYQWKEMST